MLQPRLWVSNTSPAGGIWTASSFYATLLLTGLKIERGPTQCYKLMWFQPHIHPHPTPRILAFPSNLVISKIIAKKLKLLRDVAYIKECLLQALCIENGRFLQLWVFLQNEIADIVQRLSGHMECQRKNKCKNFVVNKLQFWRVKDNTGTAHLALSSRFYWEFFSSFWNFQSWSQWKEECLIKIFTTPFNKCKWSWKGNRFMCDRTVTVICKIIWIATKRKKKGIWGQTSCCILNQEGS